MVTSPSNDPRILVILSIYLKCVRDINIEHTVGNTFTEAINPRTFHFRGLFGLFLKFFKISLNNDL